MRFGRFAIGAAVAVAAVAAVVIVAMGVGEGPVWAQEAEEVADDHGNTPPTATDLPLGGSLAGRIDPLFDRDFFKSGPFGQDGRDGRVAVYDGRAGYALVSV